MRSFEEDFEDQDEFESFSASRRLLRDKQHAIKTANRKFRKHGRKGRWENDSWDAAYEYDDYDDFDFDQPSDLKLND